MKVAKIHVSEYIIETRKNILPNSKVTASKLYLSSGIQMASFWLLAAMSMIGKLSFGTSKETFKLPHPDSIPNQDK